MSTSRHPNQHEAQDVQPAKVAYAGCGLLLGILVVLGLMAALTAFFINGRTAETNTTFSGLQLTSIPTPEPGLQEAPAVEWQRLQATQEAQLNSYGWIDAEDGVAHVPIERAMSLLLEQGLPTTAPTATASATPMPTATNEVNE